MLLREAELPESQFQDRVAQKILLLIGLVTAFAITFAAAALSLAFGFLPAATQVIFFFLLLIIVGGPGDGRMHSEWQTPVDFAKPTGTDIEGGGQNNVA